jgi:protein arginine N-methyltransferase 5
MTSVIVVAGAGRGPIVEAALKAAAELNLSQSITLYALDKNTMAINTLLHLKKTSWKDRVSVVCADMRTWKPEELVDILVSELLGSFGDNELSPECLDGAQRILKRKLHL